MKKYLSNERGLSLVEVVTSLIIISIILISFFGLFVQSKKAGVSSENTVDATYLAQQTMEEVYNIVKISGNLVDFHNRIQTKYTLKSHSDNVYVIVVDSTEIKLTAKPFLNSDGEDDTLVYVKTEIPRQNINADPVVMETIWLWRK